MRRFCVVLALMTAGCAYAPLDVKLAALAPAPQSAVGAGTRLDFRFVDERLKSTLGQRIEIGPLANSAPITAADLPAFVEKTLRDGMAAKGYELAGGIPVTFHLRVMTFGMQTPYESGRADVGYVPGREAASPSGTETAYAVLAVDSAREGRSYKNFYRAMVTDGTFLAASDGQISARVNAALSSVLEQVRSDQKLDLFLTEK
jgi:uncharacterized lipoprotein YajG